MCARFEQTLGPAETAELAARLGVKLSERSHPRSRLVLPTDEAVLVSSSRVLDARFGFRLGGGRLVLNGRSETMSNKPMFRRILDTGRVIVPMTGFYERGPTSLVRFTSASEPFILAAALLDSGASTFVLLTTAADDTVRQFHDRMPVILSTSAAQRWLHDGVTGENLFGSSRTQLSFDANPIDADPSDAGSVDAGSVDAGSLRQPLNDRLGARGLRPGQQRLE